MAKSPNFMLFVVSYSYSRQPTNSVRPSAGILKLRNDRRLGPTLDDLPIDRRA